MNIRDEFEKLTQLDLMAKQELTRTTEPEGVTARMDNVQDYNRVLDTNMVANYTAGLELLWRLKDSTASRNALDLCCGPGHMSLYLKQYLGFQDVKGIDLSRNMIEVAKQNAKNSSYGNSIKFEVGNVAKLKDPGSTQFDLVLFSNSAHHFDRISEVQNILKNAERLVSPRGTILLTDLGRLKTRKITERFVELAGAEFKHLGMPHMYEDFYNSMFAAWTSDELRNAIPLDSTRKWIQMVPTGLPNYLALIGLPKERNQLFLRPGHDWEASGILSNDGAKAAWPLLKNLLKTAVFSEEKTFEIRKAS